MSPINQEKMKAMMKQYGKEKGKIIYYSLEMKEKSKKKKGAK